MTLTVRELIEILSRYDGDKEVYGIDPYGEFCDITVTEINDFGVDRQGVYIELD